MPIKIVLSDFGINPKEIPVEVKEKLSFLSQSSKSRFEKSYGSAENFLATLYHLRFIEKWETNQIAHELNVSPINIDIQLYNLSWYYSTNYIENTTLFQEDLKETKKAFAEAKINSQLLDVNLEKHQKLREALNNANNLHIKTYQNLGFQTKQEYIRTIYYLFYEKQPALAPRKLIPLFNLSHSAIEQRLRILGLNSSLQEGIQNKKERKSQNYVVTNHSGKKTRTKQQLKTFSTSSKNEDYVRAQLANYLYDHFDSKKYEVIIGISNTGVLGSLEIDIPVIVYEVEEKRVYRFAIEYNGDYFHASERDEKKKNAAKDKGWHYIPVVETSNGKYSNKLKLLDPIVQDLCKKIKDIVEYNTAN